MYTPYFQLLSTALLLAAPAVYAASCSSTDVTTLSNGYTCTPLCSTDRPGGDYSNSYTGSYSDCLGLCGNDSSCATAQYREDSGYCYLKNTVNPSVSSNTTDTVDCCPGVSTISSTGRICTPTCGQDRPGGDYAHKYVGTSEACAAACGADTNCVTGQFSLANGYCYFKDSSHDFSSNPNVNTFDCCPGPVTANGRTCTTTCGTDRQGQDYNSSYVGTVDACISACAADSNCATAQYHISDGYCYFKNSVNSAMADLGVQTVDCS